MGLVRRLTYEDYTVAWITALPIELAAAQGMLDEIHDDLPLDPHDNNSYTLGNIGCHNIVIACLPSGLYGTNSAAVVGSHLQRSFPSIQIGLLVGIGGGVPDNTDVRLGDVVVSHEVLQYDFGKTVQSGRFVRTSNSVRPPRILMTTVSKLRAKHESEPTKIPTFISEMVENNPFMEYYTYPNALQDWLFDVDYEHSSTKPNCNSCDKKYLKERPPRKNTDPKIHYGVIASGNQVLKHGVTRELWSEQENVLCFEMEAAGVMEHFPCLIIRGICDYADTHKNKGWQPYAASVAAAYAKEFISVLNPQAIQKVHRSPLTQTLSPTVVETWSPAQSSYQHGVRNLTEEEKKRIMNSLQFDQIDDRRMAIGDAHANTCQWLLTKQEYLDWQDPGKSKEHHGFLWIKGKPGAGKSTLVKFLLHTMLKKNMENTSILSFFFNARGNNLEKSVLGLYRSLLLQLLTENPSLQDVLNSPSMPLTSIERPVTWTVELLKELFQQAVQALEGSSLVCFVDALDECDQNEVRKMVSFFESLGESSDLKEARVYTCFSSRHYPYITPKYGLQLTLESQDGHQDDIAQYIKKQLRIGGSKLAQEIKAELQQKASGVFMWVVLVTEILNREYDSGRISVLRQRLHEIPGDLHKLFYNILTHEYSQFIDKTHKEELLLCLQWVVYARQPLRLEELYFVIQLGTTKQMHEPWNSEEISLDDMRRFILNASKGLADVGEQKTSTVQFIHESVRDFLVKDGGLKQIWPELRNFEGQSHERLKRNCVSYCSGDIVRYSKAKLQSLRQGIITINPWEQTTEAFPFLKYAVDNLLYHADKAGGLGIPQHEFIINLKLDVWNHFRGIVKNFSFHWSTDSMPSRRLLYTLAAYNTPYLIEACPSPHLCFEEGDEQLKLPILQAVAARSHEAVGVFVKELLKVRPLQDSLKAIIERTGQSQIQNVARFTFSSRRSVLSHLAEYGEATLFALYLETKIISPNHRDHDGQTPIHWASKFGHEAIVNILLSTDEVEQDAADIYGQTPLYWASRNGHINIVRVLIRSGRVNVNACDNMSQTPLLWAARNGHADVTKVLLGEGKAATEACDASGHSPLLWAARNCHEAVVRLLLQLGQADPNARDQDEMTPVLWALKHKQDSMIDIFREAGARVSPDSTVIPTHWHNNRGYIRL